MTRLYRLYHTLFFAQITYDGLSADQQRIVDLNTRKHARILLLMLVVMPYVYYVIHTFYPDKIDTVLNALFGVLFISGTAWFSITFGAIPVRYLGFALQITSHLFTAFAVALSAVFIAACMAVPLLSPIMVIAFFALYSASVKYDTADALKIGIDEIVYQHASVGRVYFTKQLEKDQDRDKKI